MVGILTFLAVISADAAAPNVNLRIPSGRPLQQIISCQNPLGLYNECHYSSLGLVSILIENTTGNCLLNKTYGIKPTHVWVEGNCQISVKISRLLK